jgi:hypothetical protein
MRWPKFTPHPHGIAHYTRDWAGRQNHRSRSFLWLLKNDLANSDKAYILNRYELFDLRLPPTKPKRMLLLLCNSDIAWPIVGACDGLDCALAA